MKKRIATLALFLVICLVGYSQKPTCSNPIGTWKNQSVGGSELIIETYNATTGAITGKYKSPSGAGSTEYPLVGWINSAPPKPGEDNVTVISFSVHWGTMGSITSWTGTCKNNEIKTIWNLVRSNSKFDWEHINTGSDNFLQK